MSSLAIQSGFFVKIQSWAIIEEWSVHQDLPLNAAWEGLLECGVDFVEAVDGVVRSVMSNLISSPEQSEGSNIVPSQWTQVLEKLQAGVTTFNDQTREVALSDMQLQLSRQQEHSFWTGPGSILVRFCWYHLAGVKLLPIPLKALLAFQSSFVMGAVTPHPERITGYTYTYTLLSTEG